MHPVPQLKRVKTQVNRSASLCWDKSVTDCWRVGYSKIAKNSSGFCTFSNNQFLPFLKCTKPPTPTPKKLCTQRFFAIKNGQIHKHKQAQTSNMEPRCPKMEPRCSKMEPRCPKMEPRCPMIEPRCSKMEPTRPTNNQQ